MCGCNQFLEVPYFEYMNSIYMKNPDQGRFDTYDVVPRYEHRQVILSRSDILLIKDYPKFAKSIYVKSHNHNKGQWLKPKSIIKLRGTERFFFSSLTRLEVKTKLNLDRREK